MIWFLLAVIGAVYILCDSEIMKGFRIYLNTPRGVFYKDVDDPLDGEPITFLGRLISCPRCTSFWVGWLGGISCYGSISLLYPLVAIGFVHIVYTLFEFLDNFIKCQIS